MSSVAGGFPDWQRITQWFGSPLDQATAFALGAGAKVVGPLEVRNFASIVVCVRPVGGTVTVTVTQAIPAGPANLVVAQQFVVAAGNVVFESFVLLAGAATITFQGSAGGETLDYAIVPSNVNTNVAVGTLTQLGFQHNDVAVANETTIDFEDGGNITFGVTDDPGSSRVKVSASTPTRSSQGNTFPLAPTVGDTFWLNRGNVMMPFVWTGGNWFSPVFVAGDVLAQAGVSQTDVGAAQYIGPAGAGAIIDPVDAFAAGCTMQVRLLAYMQGSSGKQAHAQLGLDGPGALAGTEVVTVTGGGAAELLAGPWVGTGTAFGITRLLGFGYRDSGGAGITVQFINFTAQWRFVK